MPQWITVQVKSGGNILLDVYYDIGKGYGEQYKISRWVTGSNDFQAVKLRLPSKHLRSFRIDPLSEPGTVYIKSIEISSLFGKHHTWLPDNILKDFRPLDISRFEIASNSLLVESKGRDPYLFIAAPVPLLNEISTIKIMIAFFSFFLSSFFLSWLLRIIDVKKPMNFFRTWIFSKNILSG